MSASVPVATAPLRRRLLCMVYETFLLLAVDMLAVGLYLLVTGNRQGPPYQQGLKLFLFLVTAAYFIHAWSGSGHTLAMKTWRIKLVTKDLARVPYRTAALRYLLAWGWFLPALFAAYVMKLGHRDTGIAIGVGILAWALTALLDRDRQFLHDRIAGTRLMALPKVVRSQ